MAFAQQHRRPRHRSPPLEASSIDDEFITHSISTLENHHLLSPGQPRSHTISTSTTTTTTDSDTDWHGISSAIRSSSSDTTSSFSDIQLPPLPTATTSSSTIDRRDSIISESESYSSVRPSSSSDTESFTDLDFAFGATLPSHDGTGTFIEQDDLNRTSEEETTTRHRETTQHWPVIHRTAISDFDPTSPSMPNILLPYGGIHLPSFATTNPTNAVLPSTASSSSTPINASYYSTLTLDQRVPPQFQPTVFPNDVMVSSDEQVSNQHDIGATDESSSADQQQQQFKFTRKRSRNLDRIPTHHPSFPGTITSFAILSAIWNNLRRLTNHLIENDTYTSDAFTTLVSEATLEGCLPFGSHLHMELGTVYANRRYEGLPGM